MTTLQKITIQIMIMQYIFSIILMISLSKQPITKASGNPKKSTNISSDAICPVPGDYEPGKPECGFIFPAFNSRTEDPDYIDIYQSNPDFPQKDLLKILQIPE